MVAAELMGSVYWRLLQKLEAKKFNVFGPEPVRLSKPHKLALILRTWIRFAVGVNVAELWERAQARSEFGLSGAEPAVQGRNLQTRSNAPPPHRQRG